MRTLETTGELDWIPGLAGGALPRVDGRSEVLAGHLLPRGFETYAKLFHPIHEDLGCMDPSAHWPSPWEDRYGRGRSDESFAARGLKWHDLAEELDLEMVPGFHLADFVAALPGKRWSRRLVGPEDGLLDVDTVHHVMRILRPHSGDQKCLHYWPATRCHDDRELLIEAPLSAMLTLHSDPRCEGSSVAMWPRDRSWLFLTHPGLPFSLLCGTAAILRDLLRDKPLDGIGIPLDLPIQHR